MTRLGMVALLVDDYDRAIGWFRDALGFDLVEDSPAETEDGRPKRWVVMAPATGAGCAVLLARADGPVQTARIGDQAGGRVGFFLHSDDFARDHARILAAGTAFDESPRAMAYGTVARFRDPWGNGWDLLQPK